MGTKAGLHCSASRPAVPRTSGSAGKELYERASIGGGAGVSEAARVRYAFICGTVVPQMVATSRSVVEDAKLGRKNVQQAVNSNFPEHDVVRGS